MPPPPLWLWLLNVKDIPLPGITGYFWDIFPTYPTCESYPPVLETEKKLAKLKKNGAFAV